MGLDDLKMKQEAMDFLTWQERFSTEEACLEAIAAHRWRDGFQCPACEHDRAWVCQRRRLRKCRACHHQVSPTAGTLFENTRVPMTKWFAALYLMTADKGGLSAERLRKMIGVCWRTAQRMLDKLRAAMADRDAEYVLKELVEVDDCLIGGKSTGGKRGRGSESKRPVLLAVGSTGQGDATFMKALAVDHVNYAAVAAFGGGIDQDAEVHSDAFQGLSVLATSHQLEARATPSAKVDEWLPLVHRVIANLKRVLIGTFHGVSKEYLQKYLDEFSFRFNRRWWEGELPFRLLEAAVRHAPLPDRIRGGCYAAGTPVVVTS